MHLLFKGRNLIEIIDLQLENFISFNNSLSKSLLSNLIIFDAFQIKDDLLTHTALFFYNFLPQIAFEESLLIWGPFLIFPLSYMHQ